MEGEIWELDEELRTRNMFDFGGWSVRGRGWWGTYTWSMRGETPLFFPLLGTSTLWRGRCNTVFPVEECMSSMYDRSGAKKRLGPVIGFANLSYDK